MACALAARFFICFFPYRVCLKEPCEEERRKKRKGKLEKEEEKRKTREGRREKENERQKVYQDQLGKEEDKNK